MIGLQSFVTGPRAALEEFVKKHCQQRSDDNIICPHLDRKLTFKEVDELDGRYRFYLIQAPDPKDKDDVEMHRTLEKEPAYAVYEKFVERHKHKFPLRHFFDDYDRCECFVCNYPSNFEEVQTDDCFSCGEKLGEEERATDEEDKATRDKLGAAAEWWFQNHPEHELAWDTSYNLCLACRRTPVRCAYCSCATGITQRADGVYICTGESDVIGALEGWAVFDPDWSEYYDGSDDDDDDDNEAEDVMVTEE